MYVSTLSTAVYVTGYLRCAQAAISTYLRLSTALHTLTSNSPKKISCPKDLSHSTNRDRITYTYLHTAAANSKTIPHYIVKLLDNFTGIQRQVYNGARKQENATHTANCARQRCMSQQLGNKVERQGKQTSQLHVYTSHCGPFPVQTLIMHSTTTKVTQIY